MKLESCPACTASLQTFAITGFSNSDLIITWAHMVYGYDWAFILCGYGIIKAFTTYNYIQTTAITDITAGTPKI